MTAPVEVTDEMVQAALLVAHNMRRGWYGLPLLSDSSSLGIHGGLADMNEAEVMRAVLAAVAPLIATREMDACIAAGQEAWPKSHTYVSENADLYRAQDHAVEPVLSAIRARQEPTP